MQHVAPVAARHRMYVVCPFILKNIEGAQTQRYNVAVVIGRDGKLVQTIAGHDSYHKSFPVLYGGVQSFGEKGIMPSQIGVQAWDLDFGRISILICFDVNFPELWLDAWALGAEIVFWPSTMSVDFDGKFNLRDHLESTLILAAELIASGCTVFRLVFQISSPTPLRIATISSPAADRAQSST